MSEATIRYAASVVEKHELFKELKHWKLSTKACINEMQHSLRLLKDSEATSKREINFARAKLVEKLKILEERAERQLHDTVRAEEERVESYVKALVVRQRRLDIAEARLKETSVGHKLRRWIEDGRSQIAIIKDALIGAKTCDLPTKLSFSIHSDLDPFLNGLSYLGILSLESNSKVINRIVGGTEEALAVRSEGDGSERQSIRGDPARKTTSTATDMFERELRKQLGKGMKFTDDRYFKAILDNHPSKIVSQKKVDERIGEKKFTTVSVTRLDDQSHKARVGKQGTNRSKSAQKTLPPKQSSDNRVVVSAREDSRTNREEMYTVQNNPTTGKALIDVNDSRALQPPEQNISSEKLSDRKDKPSVRYLGYDFVKEITPYNKESNVDLSDDSLDGRSNKSYDLQRPQSPISTSNGSVSSISYTPSSSHASGPTHISPKTARKLKSYFTYKAKFHTKKHPDDTDLCRLAGIAALTNGKVVVSDISHLQLMLFDDDMSYLYSLECPSPGGLCVVSSGIVAAALFHNRKVLLVKVHDLHMERFREVMLSCPETLHAVSYCEELFYVMCFKGDIHIMESDGRHSKTVRTISTYMKDGEAKHMETDPESKAILVSGYERVICFSNEGKRLWQYINDNPKKKLAPCGIVLYNDRIFVADWAGHRVIELSLTGTFVRSVIVDNIEYPHGLSVNRQRGLMYVTQSNFFKQEARSRSVKVFLVK